VDLLGEPMKNRPAMFRVLTSLAICATGGLLMAAQPITTDTHRFTEIRNGIYLAQTTAPVFNSNAVVIVNDDDVVLIDSHVTPSKARDLITAVKTLTSNPITTLVNSHHHWDHAHGNQEFGDITIIGHEFTHMKLATAPLEEGTYTRGIAGNDVRLTRMREQIASTSDASERAQLDADLELFASHVRDFDEIAPIPPTVTMNDRMTLYRGGREIQIMFLGRAHTGGDVAVYFPDDKVVFTGDMALNGPSYLGDGFVDEWPQTLENLKALDFDVFVPGHGGPVTDLNRIDLVQEYYRDLWQETAAKRQAGVDVTEASRTIDLTSHTGIPIRQVGVDPLTIQRIYDRLENPD
jgi:glyoxylase-like metal-dependent hydrolase (beta-lactamase superfamily II)